MGHSFYYPLHAVFDQYRGIYGAGYILLYPPDASGGYHGFRGGMPPPQCVDDFSLPLCSQKY